MAELRVFGRRSAFNVQKVLWTLGELELSFEHVEVGGAAGGLDRPEFLALNPNGAIPVLCDGSAVLWESHTIVRYLAAQYSPGSLWPLDPAERSRADRWMDWMQTALQPEFMGLFWGYYRTPPALRDETALARFAKQCERLYGRLDAHLLALPFVAGDELTIGDIPVGTSLFRYREMGLPVPAFQNLERYYGRLRARPAYREHIMRPFEELRGRQTF